jgi:hypothetical protein
VNDLHLAAVGGAIAALLFIVAAVRSAREREHRIWMAAGCAFLAGMFAVVFYDLGNIVQNLTEGLERFSQDLGELPQL